METHITLLIHLVFYVANYIFICFPYCLFVCLFFGCGAPTQRVSWPPHSWDILDHTQWRTTFGRTPLDEWSARHRDLYLTTHNTHNRQTSTPPADHKPTIPAGERPQTHAPDSAATGTGLVFTYTPYFQQSLHDMCARSNKNTGKWIF
jgi:hypothetical protein